MCPRASESQATYDLVTSISPDLPIVLINPELIDAGVVGFGMGACLPTCLSHPVQRAHARRLTSLALGVCAAGRRIRDEIESKFDRAYYLKTLEWGALTRRWPRGYSVWEEDEKVEEGYKLLKVRRQSPCRHQRRRRMRRRSWKAHR